MARADISEAIQLFQYSDTALGGRGQVGTWPGKIVQKLRQLSVAHEVGFHVSSKPSNRGSWLAGRRGFDLRVNTHYIDGLPPKQQLAALSLVLVHEATHAVLNFTRLYDELAARRVPIYYYRELSGPGVFNEAADNPGEHGPSARVRLPASGFQDYREQSDALYKEQLIDLVLSIDTYTDSSYIDAQWVVDNLGNWGGLANRLPETKGLYIEKLAETYDRFFTMHILDIMESVQKKEEWDDMMAAAGRKRTIRIDFEELATSRAAGARIAALERRWHVTLTEQPSKPARR